jgi:hypothetical protein
MSVGSEFSKVNNLKQIFYFGNRNRILIYSSLLMLTNASRQIRFRLHTISAKSVWAAIC